MQRPPDERRAAAPIVEGARWYRERIRKLGPIIGLVPMGVLGFAAFAVLRVGAGRLSGLFGLVVGCAAAPGLLIAGAPFAKSTYFPIAIVASAIGWTALGYWASRRATRSTLATWHDYWRELGWMTVAVLLGVVGAFMVAGAVLGEPLVN